MRKLVAWLMLVLFGTVSLLGQGLHALVGCDPLTHRMASDQASRTHAGCHCSHHASRKDLADENQSGEQLTAGHHGDCAICRFLAQGSELARLVFPPHVRFSQPYQPLAAVVSPAPAALEPYQARAPPATS